MKQFFKFMFASMLGVFLSLFLLLVVFILFLAALFSAGARDESTTISKNSLLVAAFDQAIPDRTPPAPFSLPGLPAMGIRNNIGLNDILANLRKAAADDNIKGIYLDLSYVPAGFATLEDIRNALIEFRERGKFILAYGEVYSQTAYYLASVADKIYLHPEGSLDFSGLSSEVVFFRGTLEKLDVQPQVIRVGTYKSAVEPFTEEEMSQASREQMSVLLQDIYSHFLAEVGKSREIPPDSLHLIADSLLVRQPADALRYGLVDGLKYKDEILSELKRLTGTDQDNDLSTIEMGDYTNIVATNNGREGSPQRIAVVYASGEIVGGEGTDFVVGSERISGAIREARRDDDIKAIVLRVNSPGGSALASDVIWREMTLAKKEKPVVVSMGNVAASGGYYISCSAHKIVAQPNTITGSIGVFAIIPNMQGFFNEKLGITFDGVKTGAYSDLGTITRPMTAGEKAIVQDYINDVYEDFTGHVAQGRGMSIAEVDSIARGRVWSGIKAREIGLADTLGGIRDALEIAAGMAGAENYRVVEYPVQRGPLEEFFGAMTSNARTWLVKKELGENYRYFEKLQQLPHLSGVQALLPFEIEIR